jgi:hypothetical protein
MHGPCDLACNTDICISISPTCILKENVEHMYCCAFVSAAWLPCIQIGLGVHLRRAVIDNFVYQCLRPISIHNASYS